MLGCLGEKGRKPGVDRIKTYCVACIKLSKYKILLFFSLSRKDRSREETESEGKCRQGPGRAEPSVR